MHELYDINISDSNVESALGYNQSNADDLMRQIYEKLPSSEGCSRKNGLVWLEAQERQRDGLVQYNEEVNKLGDDLRELYGNVGEILGRIRDGTLEADIYGAESIKAEAVTEKWSNLGW